MKIYTRRGDDGTTGLLYGGRVRKISAVVAANGAVDEAQAALGAVRAEVERGSELDVLLVGVERDLYVLMAELATAPANRHKLSDGTSRVDAAMVRSLEEQIDRLTERFPPISDFVVPGHDRVSALLDVARTVVRRAERAALLAEGAGVDDPGAGPGDDPGAGPGADREAGVEAGPVHSGGAASPAGAGSGTSQVGPYLNRLSDLVWTMARWQEQGDSLLSRRARSLATETTETTETEETTDDH